MKDSDKMDLFPIVVIIIVIMIGLGVWWESGAFERKQNALTREWCEEECENEEWVDWEKAYLENCIEDCIWEEKSRGRY